jgi:hypothetical protein
MKICILFHFLTLMNAASASFCDVEERYVSQEEENAPSPAPSINIECKTKTSNARGRYTSTVAPCTLQFHKADESQRELDLIQFHTSDLCSEDNAFLTVREYVSEWPDECVGDFQRCYSLEHHRPVVWDFLCAKDWEVPEGTTHVSVDCSKDKYLVLEGTTQRGEDIARGEHEARLDTYEVKLFNLALVLGACLVGVYAISNLIVKPLVAPRSSCNHHVLPRSSSCGCETCQEEVQSPIISEDAEDESFQSTSMMEDFDSQVPADFDAVPIELHQSSTTTWRSNSELSTETESQSRSTDDFGDSHQPIEDEQVPMVLATTDDFGDSQQPMEDEQVPMVLATTTIPIALATILYS